jgi:predicted type IV restriction endonuclease
VCDEAAGRELVRIVADLEGVGWELRAPRRVRPPRGGRAEAPDAARLLQDDGVFIVRSEPAQLATDARRLVPACVEVWSALAPLHRWLVEHVQYATVA